MSRPTQSSGIDQAAIHTIRRTPALIRELVEGLPAEVTDAPLDDDWSARDVVAHLLDTDDIAFRERIRRIIDEDRPFIRSIDAPARLENLPWAKQPIVQLVARMEASRGLHAAWLESLTAAQLSRVGEHDEAGEITAANIANYWAVHDLVHIQQIEKILVRALTPRIGNMRRFVES